MWATYLRNLNIVAFNDSQTEAATAAGVVRDYTGKAEQCALVAATLANNAVRYFYRAPKSANSVAQTGTPALRRAAERLCLDRMNQRNVR
eukprot:6174259-Pleurochrysis_carterae.AAC.5